MEILHSSFCNLLLASLFFFFFFFVSASASNLYQDALLSLKADITDEYGTLSDWSHGKTSHVCSWTGVTCDENSTIVVSLDLSAKSLAGEFSGEQFSVFAELVDLNLSYNSFSGQLPVGIFDLTRLETLDISRNNFSGHFPSGISGLRSLVVLDAFSNSFSGELPGDVSRLGNLRVLNFAGSYFKGPIPPEYGSFEKLEFLHLAGNFLAGKLPPELGMLKTVKHVEIGYNSYRGNIPWQFGNMSELRYLDIADANLSGSIPKALGNLTKLESLFLFKNELSGDIPWEFGGISALESLDLSDNLIVGSIPKSFSELKNLKLLSVMYNAMSGSVPEEIAELPTLETLLIWNNFFDGILPPSLGRKSKLKWVDVSTNNLNGSIPIDICVNGELEKLILFSNHFTGEISPALKNCSSLVRIRIEENSFSGEIPFEFSHLPDITYVDLSRNKFTGGIPIDLSQAIKLQYFNVSENPELGGTIPSETWTLPILQNFSAFSCGISGDIPSFQGCDSISVIELSGNGLSGAIPVSISNCNSVERISLASNNLSGHLPDELADLPRLSSIDLSHNSFSGQIPARFGLSSSLLLLNVSFNDVSGSIPSERAFREMGKSAFIGNPNLCGAPLRPCSGSNSMPIFGSRRTGKLVWALLLSIGIAILITLLIIALLYLRRSGQGQWKMISYGGFPNFKALDVLKSFNSVEFMDGSVTKAVLPTGITVSVKKIETEANTMKYMLEFIAQIGNARHRNLTRLLGVCHNNHTAYLLYDYLPGGSLGERIGTIRDWPTKYRIITGVARGLCFLHHHCFPAIPHGDLRSSNVVFDESMETHLSEFGIKSLRELNSDSVSDLMRESGEFTSNIIEELYADIYSFGEILLEILTNGRLVNAGETAHKKPREALLKEILGENEVNSIQEEIEVVLDVALHCTSERNDRPSMEEALRPLAGLHSQRR